MKADMFAHINPSPQPAATGGLLTGKSFVVQPNMSVRGWPTEAGSLALKGFTAIEDATAIARLKEAGAVLVGSTRMSEFGLGLHGDTAGLALSQGLADAALMTDTMGEPRITAARAGAYGFKPTGGVVSRFGLIGLIPSMESFAVVARSPDDIAAVMSSIAGSDHRDFSMCDGPAPAFTAASGSDDGITTIGIVRECVKGLADEETGVFMTGVARLRERGCDVREVSLPDFDLFRTVHHVIGSVEASSSCGKYDGVRYGHRAASAKNWNEMYLKTRAECFGLMLKTYLFQGAYFQFQNYAAFEKASRIRAGLANAAGAVFAAVDALAFPTRRRGLPGTDRGVTGIYDACALTLAANVLGLPALHIPGFVLEGTADYGLQLVGARFSDTRLLSGAARLSREQGA
jgi:aspartyl-tRNA(Asn)/glutamyl-tRNA(Gln) amidotransferase subunit A